MSKALLDTLQKERVITSQQYAEAIEALSSKNTPPIFYLIDKKYLSDAKLLNFLAQKYGLPVVNISKIDVPPEVIKLVPVDLARKYGIVPIQQAKNTLVVAVADPTVLVQLEDIRFRTKMNVEAVLASYMQLDAALGKFYNASAVLATAIDQFAADAAKSGDNFEVDRQQAIQVEEGTSDDAPIITLVNNILLEGVRRGASDIHVESYEKKSRVRMRIDGYLQEILAIPPNMRRPVIARFKIMSKMDIAESRIPQDGRIKIKIGNQEVDFRVSTMPCLFGEKVVLRILSTGNLSFDMAKLGFEEKQLEVFKKGIHLPNGMVLVTGPTGSGKTTTLYSALAELNQIDTNISTAEDPVEYNLEGINQVQVNKDIGLNFASVLRTFLRQDPDVILVGEIRDYETAEVAIQAALTGHLVLSTLHTNDAPSTVLRLMNMGIEPFLVASSVNTIVAQRLLRRICTKCREEVPVATERLTKLGFPPEYAQAGKVFKGRGCQNCGKSGYKGRVAIYEVMDITTAAKEMILSGGTAIELKRQAIKDGMQTLRVNALLKVISGITSLEEALSMTQADS